MASRIGVLALLLSACQLNQRPEAGGIAVVVETDMALGKDIDELQLEVTLSGKTLMRERRSLSDGPLAMPAKFEVPRSDDRSAALIRMVAYKDGVPRVERSAITPIPSTYLGELHLPVNFLCDATATEQGESTCGVGMTCRQGSCVAALQTEELSAYDFATEQRAAAVLAAGDAGSAALAANGACFDVSKCFAEATEVMPDPTTCSFRTTSLFGDMMNVALRLELGSAGVCDDSACWVVLNAGAEGYQLMRGQVLLPKAICERRQQGNNLRLAVTQLCPSKRVDTPSCSMMRATIANTAGTGGMILNVASGTGMAPAVGDACTGSAIHACGMCGKSQRMCQNGLWSGFSGCADEGTCMPDVAETCGTGGTRSCGGDCTWSGCENQSCDGPATRACGNCGTQHRSCDNGVWGEWSACENQGECAPNATEACGAGGLRACGGSCTWGPCGMQQCPGAPTAPCGVCGTQTRTCDGGTANWSPWGACEGEGVCTPNSTRSCGVGGTGTQTCGGKCVWDGACTGQKCTGPATQACGYCGTQTRTCDMTSGTWSDWSLCSGEGVCSPDSTRRCGANESGTQTCAGNCMWDAACTGQRCLGDSTRACGNCGSQTRKCDTNSGTWSDWSACSGEGDCVPGNTRACGASGTQTCGLTCRWNAACPGQMCDGPTTRTCGMCGTQSRSCDTNSGKWGNWTTCKETGVCNVGDKATRDCALHSEQTCGGTCQWGACTCANGYSACGAAGCFDLQNDSAHCGTCDKACGSDQMCQKGQCTCKNGGAICNGACVSLQNDEANCGRCGVTCGGGKSCVNGACTCPKGQVECNGSCVNVSTNTANCGKCNNACGKGQSCTSGECSCPDGTRVCGDMCIDNLDHDNCRSCGTKCGPTQMCTTNGCVCTSGMTCGSQCVDSNNDHCGSCSNACGSDRQCNGTDCVCNSGLECNGSCVDRMNDPRNCGTCGNVCGGDRTCSGGKCVCTGGLEDCGGVCVNTRSDPSHCGDCKTQCSGDLKCVSGGCECAGGGTNCGGSCVDTQSDAAHCGKCSIACGAGHKCSGGECVCDSGKECGGECVDTQSDSAHCGDCNTVCAAGVQHCSRGQCVCTDAGTNLCGNKCVDTQSDHDNCGKCGQACGTSQACVAGKCTCLSGKECGPGVCVDVNGDDANNCGDCGVTCRGADRACSKGNCMCTGGLMECSGACVDVSSNDANCGGCGKPCTGDLHCSGGSCKCATGKACGNACVDTSKDAANCGDCMHACAADQTCSSGTCQCKGNTIECPGVVGCVDPQNDAAHCGGCTPCASGAVCRGGQCACPAGENLCDGRCTADSVASCGPSCEVCRAPANATPVCKNSGCDYECTFTKCGNACCASGEECIAGACGIKPPPEPPPTVPPVGGSDAPSTP